MLTRTVFLVEQALDSAKLKPSDIDHVVLVGGSTRIPKVKTMLGKDVRQDAEVLRQRR
jgi:molecular chaperone DnaK